MPDNYTSMPEWWQLLYGQYTDPIWMETQMGGGGTLPTFSVTGTALAPRDNEGSIDYSWLWAPISSWQSGQPSGGDAGGGGGVPATTAQDWTGLPSVPEDTPQPTPVFTIDVNGQPILIPSPEVPTIPAEPINPGIISPAYTWLPDPFGETQPPPAVPTPPPGMEPTVLPGGDSGIPTFPIDVWGQPVPPTPVEPIPGTPIDPGIINGPVTWLPVSNPGQPTTPNGPIFTPWFPSPDPTTPTTPPFIPGTPPPVTPPTTTTPTLPKIDIPVGDGAPGPGPLAPVVGDPVPKKSLFEGVYTPDKIPTLSEILAQVLHGGSYAR